MCTAQAVYRMTHKRLLRQVAGRQMSKSATEFFQNTEISGALTPEQAAELMALAETGDTGDQPDEGGAPSPAPAPASDTGSVAAAEPDGTNSVLMAKDGKHTIPYDRLVEARTNAQQWQAQAEAAQRELEAHKANAQARADDGQAPTRTDNMVAAAEAAIDSGEVDASIFGDFSEEALAAGIRKMVSAQVRAEVSAATAPLRQQEQQNAMDSHYGAILQAHPDAASVVQSAELDAWVKSCPSYAQPAMRQVLKDGETAQVIELLSSFKAATGTAQNSAASHKQAAQAAIERAQSAVPASLSDIPGGRVDALTAHERMAGMDGAAMSQAMSTMAPEQIEAFLNRQM